MRVVSLSIHWAVTNYVTNLNKRTLGRLSRVPLLRVRADIDLLTISVVFLRAMALDLPRLGRRLRDLRGSLRRERADRAGAEKQSTYVEFLESRLKET